MQGPGKPIVVLEGPDGGGKTTLSDALGAKGFEYDHCGPAEKPSLNYYLDTLFRHPGAPAVMDRLHIGSYVYGKAFRGIDDLTVFEHWIIGGTVLSRNGLMVYCAPPFEVTQKNLERGPDNADATIYEDPAKRLEVRSLYESYLFGESTETGFYKSPNQIPVMRYDYTIPGAFEEVMAEATAEWRFQPSPVDTVPALGNTRNPKLVLVGDVHSAFPRAEKYIRQRGIEDRSEFLRLFAGIVGWEPPFVSASGRYLHLAMTAGNISLQDTCVFDATQLDGLTVNDFFDFRAAAMSGSDGWGYADFVALGQNAHRELEKANIIHRTVEHPSFWMRTQYKNVSGYAKALKGAA